jgi:hypothetical protein
MRKALRYVVLLFLLILSLSLLAPPLKVKASGIGVSPGQLYTYGTSDGSPWVTMNPSNAPPLATWETYMNFSTISLNITSVGYVDVNVITFGETVKFRNGTTVGPFQGGFDVYSGSGGGVFFIQAGLGAGMRLYPGNADNTYVVNETRIDQAFWPGRKVCLLNYTTASPLENKSSPMAVRMTVIYYDYATGVLLSAFEEGGLLDPKTGEYLEGYLLFELIANNVGIPMNYPHPIDMTPVYIVIAVIAILVVIVVIVRAIEAEPKKKHKRLK